MIRDVIMIKAGGDGGFWGSFFFMRAGGQAPPNKDAGPGVAAWIVSSPRAGLSVLLGLRPKRFYMYVSSL